MQPYFFPYLGYFQLIAASDIFVLYDDTQLISRGWVNRNRILVNGAATFLTLPLKKGHLWEDINCRQFVDDIDFYKKKLLKAIQLSYARAPYFDRIFPFIEIIISSPEKNVAAFNENLIRKTCGFLEIRTEILISSRLGISQTLKGQDRVIATSRSLGACCAINPIGGVDLYSYDEFMQHGIELKFIKMDELRYRQFGDRFLENLSIIDVLMFCEISEVQRMLASYSLLGQPKTQEPAR